MWREDLKQHIKPIILEVIIGIFLILVSVFVIESYNDNLETKQEIDYRFDQANLFFPIPNNLKKQLNNITIFLKYHIKKISFRLCKGSK